MKCIHKTSIQKHTLSDRALLHQFLKLGKFVSRDFLHSMIQQITGRLLCNSNIVFKTRLFTIFDFKKCHDLEIGVRGHSVSLKVATFDRLCMVSDQSFLVTLSLKRTVFEIFNFKNAVTLKNRVRGPSRSFEISPFDRAHTTSY